MMNTPILIFNTFLYYLELMKNFIFEVSTSNSIGHDKYFTFGKLESNYYI